MSRIASEICGFHIEVTGLGSEDFLNLALSSMANPDGDRGYVEYMKSVGNMFDGLAEGRFPFHTEVFQYAFRDVCGRRPKGFREWLETSPYRTKLERS